MPPWLPDRPIAHRGLHDNRRVAENSLTAFDLAAQAGHPIELDVQLTVDGNVVAFHDDDLRRACGLPLAVSETFWSELSRHALFGTADAMPLFSDTLRLVAGRVPLLIEVKNEGAVGPLEARVAAILDCYAGPFAVQSFNPWSVFWFRRNRPGWVRGQLLSDYHEARNVNALQRFALHNMLLHPLTRPCFIAADIGLLGSWRLGLLRRYGLPLLAWTVKGGEQRRFCEREGVVPICDNLL